MSHYDTTINKSLTTIHYINIIDAFLGLLQ